MIQRGSKWTQNKVFQLPLKMGACIFSASLHEVSNGQSENILNDFLEKILFWGYCTKLHLTGAEMRFFKYYKKSRLAIFLKFCLKSKQHEVLKFALFWGGRGGDAVSSMQQCFALEKSFTWVFVKKESQNELLNFLTNWCFIFLFFKHF